MIDLFIGYDPREAAAYHVCCQSIIEKASEPVAIHPLAKSMLKGFDTQRDGTNAFTYSRYLVPELMNFEGWAIFLDGDMVVDVDVAELWKWTDVHADKAVAVVLHDYKTKHSRKYIGSNMESKNEDYPRKNCSSVILWNCGHPANRGLTPGQVATMSPATLHRFAWLDDKEIGGIPQTWNHLVGEFPPASPSLYHYTLGVPGLKHYADNSGSWKWHGALVRALRCADEVPSRMVQRSEERVGDHQ